MTFANVPAACSRREAAQRPADCPLPGKQGRVVRMCAYVCVCGFTSLCVCVCVRVSVCCVCVHVFAVRACMCARACVCTRACARACVCDRRRGLHCTAAPGALPPPGQRCPRVRCPEAGSQHEVTAPLGDTGHGALARGPGAQPGGRCRCLEASSRTGHRGRRLRQGQSAGGRAARERSACPRRRVGCPGRLTSPQEGGVAGEGFLCVRSLFSWGAFPAHTFGT